MTPLEGILLACLAGSLYVHFKGVLQRVEKLEQRVEKLEQRVEELQIVYDDLPEEDDGPDGGERKPREVASVSPLRKTGT